MVETFLKNHKTEAYVFRKHIFKRPELCAFEECQPNSLS